MLEEKNIENKKLDNKKEDSKVPENSTDIKKDLEKNSEKKEKAGSKEVKIEEFRTISPSRPKREIRKETKKEFEEKVLEIKRVARVVKGGRRFKFRAAVVIGNHGGKVGIGLGKGSEVITAVNKAVSQAKKNIIEVRRRKTTIPFEIKNEFKSAEILLKPAKEGTGIIAGGPVRAVVELAGISDISSKMLGSSNKINNMISTFNALKKTVHFEEKR